MTHAQRPIRADSASQSRRETPNGKFSIHRCTILFIQAIFSSAAKVGRSLKQRAKPLINVFSSFYTMITRLFCCCIWGQRQTSSTEVEMVVMKTAKLPSEPQPQSEAQVTAPEPQPEPVFTTPITTALSQPTRTLDEVRNELNAAIDDATSSLCKITLVPIKSDADKTSDAKAKDQATAEALTPLLEKMTEALKHPDIRFVNDKAELAPCIKIIHLAEQLELAIQLLSEENALNLVSFKKKLNDHYMGPPILSWKQYKKEEERIKGELKDEFTKTVVRLKEDLKIEKGQLEAERKKLTEELNKRKDTHEESYKLISERISQLNLAIHTHKEIEKKNDNYKK